PRCGCEDPPPRSASILLFPRLSSWRATVMAGRTHLRVRYAFGIVLAMSLISIAPRAGAANLFAAPFINFDAGVDPISVATGDLNGDGRVDVVLAHPDVGKVSVMLGIGDGTFGPQTFYDGTDP